MKSVRCFAMLVLLAAAIAPRSSAAQGGNLILNGDFENVVGAGCQYNVSNWLLNSTVPGTTGFGSSNEIDVMSGTCFGPNAISGSIKLGLHTKPDGSEDAFSFDLSTPIVAGRSYSLSYWALAEGSLNSVLGSVGVGVSNSPTAFGTQVHAGTLTSFDLWTHFTFSFVAPTGAAHLTVTSGTIANAWSHVDAFSLVEACTPPTVYCTPATSTYGCVPSISGVGAPSASATSGFTISVSHLDGQRTGLIFYGIDNSGWTPLIWASGSTSYLCVKPPVQRTPLQYLGGTFGQCNGALSIDWNAFVSGTPGALGAPFGGYENAYAQSWFRDPAAAKSTNLSDALWFGVCP